MIEFLQQNWITVILSIISFIGGFLISYLKERVKNKALLADIRRLEEEKQQVRKEHQLDIEKRKYKYESKREQFTKYFNLIDSFAVKSNEDIKNQFLPLITAYNNEYLSADGNQEKETLAVTKFSDGLNKFMFSANENLIKLRSETTGIKMIAGSKTLELLEKMSQLYDTSFDLTSKMIKELIPAVLTNDFLGVQQVEEEVRDVSEKLNQMKELIILEIRNELDEI